MNIKQYKEKAKLIRDTEVYRVYDLDDGHLVVSLTELKKEKWTSGHSHDEADEVYVFISGKGEIQIGEEISECQAGDVFNIPRGMFHKVFNMKFSELIFWSIFEKYGDRK